LTKGLRLTERLLRLTERLLRLTERLLLLTIKRRLLTKTKGLLRLAEWLWLIYSDGLAHPTRGVLPRLARNWCGGRQRDWRPGAGIVRIETGRIETGRIALGGI
jgi:hypothetical protein